MGTVLAMPEVLSLAMHALVLLAKGEGKVMKSEEIAERIGCSHSNLVRSLQMLKKAGLLKSEKGPGGGYSLARPADTISLLEIHEATCGPLYSPGCGLRECRIEGCDLAWFSDHITEEFRRHFSKRTLAELADPSAHPKHLMVSIVQAERVPTIAD
jgi:Rrf2 family protein